MIISWKYARFFNHIVWNPGYILVKITNFTQFFFSLPISRQKQPICFECLWMHYKVPPSLYNLAHEIFWDFKNRSLIAKNTLKIRAVVGLMLHIPQMLQMPQITVTKDYYASFLVLSFLSYNFSEPDSLNVTLFTVAI